MSRAATALERRQLTAAGSGRGSRAARDAAAVAGRAHGPKLFRSVAARPVPRVEGARSSHPMPGSRLKRAGRPRRVAPEGASRQRRDFLRPARAHDASRSCGGDPEGARGTRRPLVRSAPPHLRRSPAVAAGRPDRSRVALLRSRPGRRYAGAARHSGARRGGARCPGDRAVDRDPDGQELSPIVTHGYPRQIVSRLGHDTARCGKRHGVCLPHVAAADRAGPMRCRTAPLRRRSSLPAG